MPFPDREGRVCGFLNIEETENSGTFCRRYFVLDQNNGKLVYFMDSPANLPEAWKSPVGEIHVQHISKVSDVSQQRPKLQHCFSITVTGYTYCLQAETEEGKQSWSHSLTNASKIRVPPPTYSNSQIEWHADHVTSQGGYVTEIAGGVVCKMAIQVPDPEPVSDDDDSRSSTSSTPPSSFSRASARLFSGESLKEQRRSPLEPKLEPIRTGFCVKQGGVRKNWKRRYFTLHEQGLSYSKLENDKQPLRTILLEDILQVKESTDGSHPGRDNLFEVITSKRTFYAQCDTPAEMVGWIRAIEALIWRRQTHKMSQSLRGELSAPQLGPAFHPPPGTRGDLPPLPPLPPLPGSSPHHASNPNTGRTDNYPSKVWL